MVRKTDEQKKKKERKKEKKKKKNPNRNLKYGFLSIGHVNFTVTGSVTKDLLGSNIARMYMTKIS